jgi:hypothetical protein
MKLSQVRLVGVGPFDDVTIRLADATGAPRGVTVVLGAGGVGKTSLLAAIASTRPGSAIPPRPRPGAAAPSFVVTEWMLGDDDPARPHPLRVASPNAALGEPEEEAVVRRREQALFDRKAGERGFVLVGFSALRATPRAPVALAPGDRANISRYDARAPIAFDDLGRADVARETKQALSYAAISAALGGAGGLDRALREACDAMARLAGCAYAGVDSATLEPVFEDARGRVPFDDLPASARHGVAFAVLTARALHGAYPDRPPRESEGVLLLDEVELHQEPVTVRRIVPALRALFPRVQMIVTTSHPQIAMEHDADEVLALRRMPASSRVEVHAGQMH